LAITTTLRLSLPWKNLINRSTSFGCFFMLI
jgi:hypothetical protein